MAAMIGLLIFPIVGYAVARRWSDSFLMGLGVVGVVLYLIALLHLPLWVSAIVVLFSLAPRKRGEGRGEGLLAFFRRPHPVSLRSTTLSRFAGEGLTWFPVAILLFTTAVTPLHDYDGRAFWLLKAKAIAQEKRIDGPFFHQQTMYDPRNEYPLLIPLDAAALMMLSGDHDEREVRWLYVLALAALALHARRYVGLWPAALITWIPQFVIAGGGSAASAYNDVPLAAFGACAFFEIVENASPLRFGLYLSFLVLTKNEGLPFALIVLVAGAFVFRRRIAIAIAPLGVALATLAIWRSRIPPGDEENLPSLLMHVHQHFDRFLAAFFGLLGHALTYRWWGLFWIGVIVATVLAIRDEGWRPVALALFVIVALFGVYVAVYMVTTWEMTALMNASADRLLMHLVGPAVYIIGVCARSRYSPAPHQPIEA